jgi:hypothetical protein
MRRGQLNPRSWDAAIDTVQQNIFAMVAGREDVGDEEDRILTGVFRRCEELRSKKYLAFDPTNAELAAKYAISERTVRNWRREGCPFAAGQWRVLQWLARRRCAPAGTRAKFKRQLSGRKFKILTDDFFATLHRAREVKAMYRDNGLKLEPDNWLRGLRCPRR